MIKSPDICPGILFQSFKFRFIALPSELKIES